MRQWKRRFLAAFLTLTMLFTLVPGAYAAENEDDNLGLSWEEVDSSRITANLKQGEYEEAEEPPMYAPDEQVRVSIVLEDQPALAMFSLSNEMDEIADYREQLQEVQEAAAEYISEEALDNAELDVVWNLTLAANIISANVEFGQIEAIKEVDGVADVVVETRYELQGFRDKDDPNLVISTGMTGTTAAWGAGYTGAGMRIAIIDTGLDIDHQSFNNDAFLHALAEDGDIASFDLLDASEIGGVLEQLNAYQSRPSVTAEQLHHSDKLPYCFNYVDSDLDVTHLNDTQGEHGSHVAGIAAANRYLLKDGEYVEAWDEVHMVGNAPDAQVLVMKVFGKGGGAYDGDYMAAIEDAILLGCDTVNLSLGSGSAGMTYSSTETYQGIMDNLVSTNTVVNMSAGNNSYWAEQTWNGELYSDDVNFQTGGSPGSFTNSLGVASVDNNGVVNGGSISALDKIMGYTETSGYGNPSILTMDTNGGGTEYDFVYVDAFGEAADFAKVDVSGKIALCNRGSTSFFEKANAASAAGAAAVIVCNNQAGTISMNLEGYTGDVPVVSITLADAEYIKANAASDTADGLAYYTGKITINGSTSVIPGTNDYETMSSFSSWGVPGDLSMKPEITAPGGSIWSVAGSNKTSAGVAGGHEAYETMSGTSMASPQIAGIGALVKQSIEERGLSQSSLTDRALAQSLMMSTATPLTDAYGEYYPVMQQGAGMVDTKAAVNADSYITMGSSATDSAADGKVKVELKDDPDRDGTYSFDFTIHNLTDEPHSYKLSADVFTQDWAYDEFGTTYMLTSTTPLNRAKFWWTADNADTDSKYDFDGNGVVNSGDAAAILDYVTGNRASIADAAKFGRDTVDSYSAYQFLQLLDELAESSAGDVVTVAPGESVTVTASIMLDQAEMNDWMAICPNGVYVEAYVFAKAVASEEGAEGTTHSIPVLGFYGNWTDASMFEKGSYVDYAYGMETRFPYLFDGASAATLARNAFLVQYAGDSGAYYFGGNPYGTQDMDDAAYLEARNALNNESGDKLSRISFTAIRNAAASRLLIKDVKTGEVYAESYPGAVSAAFYYANNSSWQQTGYNLNLNWAGTDKSGAPLPEDTTVEISLTLAPELYVNADGSVNWDAMGDGASLTTQLTIDNKAPKITGAYYASQNRSVAISVQDNQYVAAVAMFTADGSQVLAADIPDQTVQGVESFVTLDLSQVLGKNFLIAAYDYAGNVTLYEFTQSVRPDIADYYTAYDRTNRNWVTYTKNGTDYAVIANGAPKLDIVAGAYAGGYVFAVDSANNLYAMEADDLGTRMQIANVSGIGTINDMAYDALNNTMYLSTAAGETGYLWTLDLSTGETNVVSNLMWNIAALAADRSGTLYGVTTDGMLYTYKTDGIKFSETEIGNTELAVQSGSSSMTWDKTDNVLALTTGDTLYVIDPATGEVTNFFSTGSLSSLFTPALPGEGTLPPAAEATSVILSRNSLLLMKGNTERLSADVGPWNLADKSVTWSSDNEAVATVSSSGVVTGVGSGTTTITATTNAAPWMTATCEVEVLAIEKDLQALVWDEQGAIWWSNFNTGNLPSYDKIAVCEERNVVSAVRVGNEIYAASMDTNSAKSELYVYNSSMEGSSLGDPGFWIADMAYAPTAEGGVLLALNGPYIQLLTTDGEYLGGYNVGKSTTRFVAIAYEETTRHSTYGYIDWFWLIDSDGAVYNWGLCNAGSFTPQSLGATGYDSGGIYYFNNAFLGTADNGNDYLFWSQYDNGDYVNILALDLYKTGNIYNLGSFASGVWPVGGLMDAQEAVPHVSSDEAKDMAELDSIWLERMTDTTPLPMPHMFKTSPYVEEEPVFEVPAVDNGETNPGDEAPIAPDQPIIPDEPVPGSGEPETPNLPEIPEQPPVDEEPSTDPVEDGGSDDEANTASLAAMALASADVIAAGETSATVQITLDQASTNGKLRITYDPNALTLDPSAVKLPVSGNGVVVSSTNTSTPGVIVYAYACVDALPAGMVIAELTFTCPAGTEATVTVTTLEDGAATNLSKTETVVIKTEQADPGPVDPTPVLPAPTPGTGTGTGSGRPSGSGSTGNTGNTGNNGNTGNTGTDIEIIDSTTPLGPTVSAASLFRDLRAGAWYSEYADYVVSKGLMQGTTASEFSPNEPLSRGMLVTILYRAAGSPAVAPTTSFSDVPAGKWYTDGVNWAAKNGLVTGYNDGTFRPNAAIARQELAAILWRYAQMTGLDVSASGTTIPDFADRNAIASWAGEAMSWAYSRGILTGDGNQLNPTKGATRIETAAMLTRFLQMVEKNADPIA